MASDDCAGYRLCGLRDIKSMLKFSAAGHYSS